MPKSSSQRLQTLALVPGVSFFFQGVQFTKQKGFGEFNLAGYYPRKYRGKVEPSGWYLLTNLSNLDTAIVALFCVVVELKQCLKIAKLVVTTSESTYAKGQRLIALILLIPIAYTCAIRLGRQCRNMGLQKYVGRLQELKRVSHAIVRFGLVYMVIYGLVQWNIGQI